MGKSDCDLRHSVGTFLDMWLCLCGCASSRSRHAKQCSAQPSKPPTNTPYPCNPPTNKLQLRWLVPLVQMVSKVAFLLLCSDEGIAPFSPDCEEPSLFFFELFSDLQE